jgi:uncharacterized protein (TIGR02246 family)
MSTSAESQVRLAAAELVAAFGAHDTERYFAAFAEDATFLFHTAAAPFRSRAEYEAAWTSWEADGFHVLGCVTTDTQVQVLGADAAVLTHHVRTRLTGEETEQRERETIVFRREPDGRWLGVHEHLSPEP